MTETRARMKYGFALLVVLGMATLLYVWPAHRQLNAAIAHQSEILASLDSAGQIVEETNALQTQIKNLEVRQTQEMKPVPERADLPGLIQSITHDISTLPLEGSNINRSRDTTIDRNRSLGLSIETSGTFEGVFDLLHRIEGLPRLIRINELTIQSASAAGRSGRKTSLLQNTELGPNDVSAWIDILAFYRPAATTDDH